MPPGANHPPTLPSPNPRWLRILLPPAFAVAGMILPSTAPAATANPAAPSEAREFVVFFGLDVSVDAAGARLPVIAASEQEVTVLRDGRPARVSLQNARLHSAVEPKLGRERVTIEGLHGERVYSPQNDPARDAIHQQMAMDAIQAQSMDAAMFQARTTAANAQALAQAASDPATGVSPSDVAEANAAASQAATRLHNIQSMPAHRSALSGTANDPGLYDAFEVTFRLATERPLPDCHGVLRLLVRDPANPRDPVPVVRFFSLRDPGARARKVTILQTGLPPGFGVDSYSVHIYSAGREVPTTLSSNQVEVTADEAHQFLILRHLQQHAHGQVPVQVIPDFLPAQLSELVPPGQGEQTVDFTIDRNGRVIRVAPTPGSSVTLTLALEAALRNVRFLPAVQNGQPVEGLGTFALVELLR